MLFLITYNRRTGITQSIEDFADERRDVATEELRHRELACTSQVDIEVVLLEAEDTEALQKSHGRYFKQLAEI